MADLEIRHASYDSANDFAQAQWRAYNEAQGLVWETEALGLLARVSGEVVGAATLLITGGVAHIEQLIIAEGFAGRGIGRRLLASAEALAAARGCHMMELETPEFGPRRLYERCGWRVAAVKERSKFGVRWYWMQKEPGGSQGDERRL